MITNKYKTCTFSFYAVLTHEYIVFNIATIVTWHNQKILHKREKNIEL